MSSKPKNGKTRLIIKKIENKLFSYDIFNASFDNYFRKQFQKTILKNSF